MGSLTLSVQKKQHRERSQPLERRKLGMLEKKKDYKLRSQDYHAKQAQLQLLRKKAEERNPDEYYHEMSHARREEDGSGVVVYDSKKGPAVSTDALTADAVKLLKTQDSSYVQTYLSKEKKNIERLEKELTFRSSGKHTVFVDSVEEADKFSAAKYFDTDKALLNRRENRLRRRQLEREGGIVVGTNSEAGLAVATAEATTLDKKRQKELNKQRLAKYKELEQRMERESDLTKVKQTMDLQRELLKKGARRKVTDRDGYSRYVWANERKR
ncbi:uncharacterized protein SAPINGB_P003909 [Magnusiomyces paraingens]|uniref:U3 small nucleolar RNA-associated protein 11 n=1 Tax=Magnusiomyces paraingens TaxID=2606893 RepID=A0A5E8BZ76_9ASCO|nr:uncharacterized protein SAPINGB_P003909 [Saprochaete ingens]VVT54105.1 unnamed protein product [Saprochaete ingens]